MQQSILQNKSYLIAFFVFFCIFFSVELTIYGSSGTAAFTGDWLLKFAYDNNNGRCYASKSAPGEATFRIPVSDVSQIRMFNRDFMREYYLFQPIQSGLKSISDIRISHSFSITMSSFRPLPCHPICGGRIAPKWDCLEKKIKIY